MPSADVLRHLDGLGLDVRSTAPWPYATSHVLTAIDAVDGAGRSRRLLHKRLDAGGLLPEAEGNRPAELVDPRREIDAYRHVLPLLDGPAACVASSVEDQWLVLEHVDGPVLWQVGDLAPWHDAARWLADAHRLLVAAVGDAPAPFLRYDVAYFGRWAARARAHEADAGRRCHLDHLLAAYGRVVDDLLGLPPTLVHGECYPSNVIVVPGAGRTRVCAVDWEMAGVGPGAVDLAALVTGWPVRERRALIGTYAAAVGRPPDAVEAEVRRAELHLCVRWLGWAPRWSPPVEHATDWLGRGIELAEEVLA
jgi:aminoglycoside phosphotransferase